MCVIGAVEKRRNLAPENIHIHTPVNVNHSTSGSNEWHEVQLNRKERHWF